MAYENKVSLRDGRIVLYTRSGGPIYHCRLSIEGLKGYVARSTKERSLERAKDYAENLYEDLRYRVRHGEETSTKSFKGVWDRWIKLHQDGLSQHRKRFITGTSIRYFIPFLGSKSLSEFNDKLITDYWRWRVDYWSSKEGEAKIGTAQKSRATGKRPYKQKLGNVARVPSQKTLEMERTVLGQILKWAHRHGQLKHVPELKIPKSIKTKDSERRPAFELDEWKTLYRFMRGWVREGITEEGLAPRKGPHDLHRWQREMVRNYILFMAASGLRPNEARQLQWQYIKQHHDENGNAHLVISIPKTTKTKWRECVPLRNAVTLIERIKAATQKTDPENLVFCNKRGEPIDNFGKTFKSILIKANLLKDKFGKDRTIYSLRHTYATFRIRYGGANIEALASNMGTSPSIIFRHYRHIANPDIANMHLGQLHRNQSRKGLYL